MNNTQRMIRRLARSLQLSENAILLGLAVLVGLSSGVGIWVFRAAIELSEELIREDLVHHAGKWGIIPALGLVGLVVGLLMQTFVGQERHHGVAGIIESVALAGGRLRYKRAPFKSVAAALSIGGGASVGPEDPSVQIGANIGSFFGQYLHLTEERIRLLVAAGAASAIAAAFNAPIAGVFFALEVILGNFATGSVGVVVLSAVMASVFTHAVEHSGPELGIRAYELGGPAQIPFYILLGITAAPFAVAFIRAVYWQHDLWHRWHIPGPLKTALAGVMVGLVGVFLPEILGAGREPMNEVLNSGGGDFTIWLLVALIFAKISMTSISMAGGFQGGIFAPSLFVGAMLGGAYGRITEKAFPQLDIGDPAAYAIAGMAAMMAGVVRAPITAILLIFELTNNYELILPIMLATVVTVFLTDRFESDGIYSKALRRVGLHIQHGRDVDVMQSVLVREVMQTPPPSIQPAANLKDLRDAFRAHHSKALCVIDGPKLYGIVSLADLQAAYENADDAENLRDLHVADICTRDVVTITPNEPVYVAIQRMGRHDFGHVPVVAPDDDTQVVGMLRRNDVMRSYNLAISRKWESQYTQQQIRLHNLVDEEVLLLDVPKNAQIIGQDVRSIKWPPETIIVSIRRGNKVFVPHGDTVIQEGDRLTAVVEPDHEAALRAIVSAPSLESLNLDH